MRIKLSFPLLLSEIAKATNGYIPKAYENKVIHYIATDSREVFKGDLFVALKGENDDGEKYVPFIINKEAFHFSKSPLKKGVKVDDTREGLLRLANYYKTKFKKLRYTIAITGSVGKTTTKEFLKVILSAKYSVHATYKNQNNTLGVPLTILSMPEGTEALVVEMGMNRAGEISKSSICASPDISIILNVGTSHIGNLGSRDNIAKAKLEILDGMKNKTLVVPLGDPLLSNRKSFTFDLENKEADYYFKDFSPITLYHRNEKIAKFNFKFREKHFRECLLASSSAAHLSGLSAQELCKGISLISEENIRQKIIRADDFYFLADYYNSSLESVKAALDSLFSLPSYQRKSVLIGDILELGEQSEPIHKELGKTIAKYNFYNLYLFGEYSKNIFEGATESGFPAKRIFINDDTTRCEITANQIRENHTRGEIILMKASRGLRLERILEEFQITNEGL